MKMYRIQEKTTGKYLLRFERPRSAGSRIAVFTKNGNYLNTKALNYYFKMAVDNSLTDFLDDVEVITYSLQATKNMATTTTKLRTKFEQEKIIRKLKA